MVSSYLSLEMGAETPNGNEFGMINSSELKVKAEDSGRACTPRSYQDNGRIGRDRSSLSPPPEIAVAHLKTRGKTVRIILGEKEGTPC
jgi:hypothetical protein